MKVVVKFRLHHQPPLPFGDVQDRNRVGQVLGEETVSAGVVDQDIYLPQLADGLLGSPVGTFAGGQFSVDRVGAAAQGANFQTYGVQLQRSAGYNGDIRSLASIGHSHGAAESAGPSRYQGNFAFQLHLYFTFLQWQGRHFRMRAASQGRDPAQRVTTISGPCQLYYREKKEILF